MGDERVRRRLLRKRDLTLTSAIDVCRGAEMTNMRMKAITQDRSRETLHVTDGRRPRVPPRQEGLDKSQVKTLHGNSAVTSTGATFVPYLEKPAAANHFANVCMKRG